MNRLKNINTILFKYLFFIFIAFSASGNTEDIDGFREKIIEEAHKYIGKPYMHGALGPEKFDCSGFICFIANNSLNKQLPRTARAIYKVSKPIPDGQIQPGDLVFFKAAGSISITHVGLYIGEKKFISAVSSGPKTGVMISSLDEKYWKKTYAGAGIFYMLNDTKISE